MGNKISKFQKQKTSSSRKKIKKRKEWLPNLYGQIHNTNKFII